MSTPVTEVGAPDARPRRALAGRPRWVRVTLAVVGLVLLALAAVWIAWRTGKDGATFSCAGATLAVEASGAHPTPEAALTAYLDEIGEDPAAWRVRFAPDRGRASFVSEDPPPARLLYVTQLGTTWQVTDGCL